MSRTALGKLDLSYNNLTYNSIALLRNIHIVELKLIGNESLTRGFSPKEYLWNVITLLPFVWSLDGRLIRRKDREDAASYFKSPEGISSTINQILNSRTKVGRGEWSHTVESISLSQRYFTIMEAEPQNAIMKEKFRCQYLTENYNVYAQKHNDWVKGRTKDKLPMDRFPLMHLVDLRSLGRKAMLDICIMLQVAASYPLPKILLREALSIYLAGILPLKKIEDIAALEPVIMDLVIFHLKRSLDEDIIKDPSIQSSMTEVEKRMWSTLDVLTATDAEAKIANEPSSIALKCRHGVILLSRSPSFPPMMEKNLTSKERAIFEVLHPKLNDS